MVGAYRKRKFGGVHESLAIPTQLAGLLLSGLMILNALALKLKRQARGEFKSRPFEATVIVQAVSWYLRYALSYRDIREMLLERCLGVDRSTINRWVLAYALAIDRRLRRFRKPHCGSVRMDETYIEVRDQWRYL